MSTLVKHNFGQSVATWNNEASGASSTIVDPMLDDAGGNTGILLRSNFSRSYSDSATRPNEAVPTLPDEYWWGIIFGTSGVCEVEMQNLTPFIGQNFIITTSGASYSSTEREMDFTIDTGSGPGPAQRYVSVANSVAHPNAPLTFTGTITSDTLKITSTLVTGLCVMNGFTFEYGVITDSVTPQDPIEDGETGINYAPSGFASGAINSVTLDSVAVAAFTASTFDNIDIPTTATSAGVAGPRLGSVVFEATNGTETANDTIVNQVSAGYSYTELGVIDAVTSETLYDLMLNQRGKTIVTGEQFLFPSSDGSTIGTSSSWEFFTLPKTFYWRENSSTKWYTLTMTTEGLLGGPWKKLTYSKLTGVKLTAQKLTAEKL